MGVRIRRGRRTDYEALSRLGSWPPVDGSARRTIRLFRKVVADLGSDLYVADVDGEAIGMVSVSYVRVLGLGGQRATLEEIFVRADRRGAGVGRELVDFVIRRARRRRAKVLQAAAPDAASERFFDRVGFRAKHGLYQLPLGESGGEG